MSTTDAATSPAAPSTPDPQATAPAPVKTLSEAAKRALAEAEARRAELDRRAADLAAVPETDGRGGPEPVRYGDWEVKGLASDF